MILVILGDINLRQELDSEHITTHERYVANIGNWSSAYNNFTLTFLLTRRSTPTRLLAGVLQQIKWYIPWEYMFMFPDFTFFGYHCIPGGRTLFAIYCKLIFKSIFIVIIQSSSSLPYWWMQYIIKHTRIYISAPSCTRTSLKTIR